MKVTNTTTEKVFVLARRNPQTKKICFVVTHRGELIEKEAKPLFKDGTLHHSVWMHTNSKVLENERLTNVFLSKFSIYKIETKTEMTITVKKI